MAASPPLTGTWEQKVSEIAKLIVQRVTPKYGNAEAQKLSADWIAYAHTHRNEGTPQQLLLAWFLTHADLGQKIGQDIITGTRTAGGVAAGIPQNLNAISPTQLAGGIWGTLTSKNLWIRIGEGIVAIILLDVGLKAFTNKSVIETVAKKTPAARTAKLLK